MFWEEGIVDLLLEVLSQLNSSNSSQPRSHAEIPISPHLRLRVCDKLYAWTLYFLSHIKVVQSTQFDERIKVPNPDQLSHLTADQLKAWASLWNNYNAVPLCSLPYLNSFQDGNFAGSTLLNTALILDQTAFVLTQHSTFETLHPSEYATDHTEESYKALRNEVFSCFEKCEPFPLTFTPISPHLNSASESFSPDSPRFLLNELVWTPSSSRKIPLEANSEDTLVSVRSIPMEEVRMLVLRGIANVSSLDPDHAKMLIMRKYLPLIQESLLLASLLSSSFQKMASSARNSQSSVLFTVIHYCQCPLEFRQTNDG